MPKVKDKERILKAARERQRVTYKQTHKQNRNRFTDAENRPMVARGDKVRKMGEKVKGHKRYKLPVIK